MIIKVANYLIKHDNKITRVEARIFFISCGFGLRCAWGDINWYHFSKEDCLKLSEELAKFVTSKLQKCFEFFYLLFGQN